MVKLKTPLLIFNVCLIVALILVSVLFWSGVYSAIMFFAGGEGGGDGGDGEGESMGFMTLPEGGDVSMTLEGDTILFSAPITFNNNGMYPIEDFSIDIIMRYQDRVIFEGNNNIGTIPGGGQTTKEISYSATISDLASKGLAGVLYNDIETDLEISVSASYLFDWISFSPVSYTHLRAHET